MIALEREPVRVTTSRDSGTRPRGQSRQIECTFLPVDKERTSSTIIGAVTRTRKDSGIWNERGQGGSSHTHA